MKSRFARDRVCFHFEKIHLTPGVSIKLGGDEMSTAILACETLADYVALAQKKEGTDYPVFYLNRRLHENPENMKNHIVSEISKMPEEIDTVLAATGFCGGAWDKLSFDRRIVIPRVDDCVTLLLHTDDTYHPDLKKLGHFYMTEWDPDYFSPQTMFDQLCENFDPEDAKEVLDMWFANYSHLDVIDTGCFDCYERKYAAKVQSQAELIGCMLEYVPGSNRILEKLVGGRWDEQFFVAEPGRQILYGDFFAGKC